MSLPVDPFRLVGTIVDGRYRVDAIAGQGGYGVVYRAFHVSFESAIALKVLKLPAHLSFDRRSDHVASFKREGKVLFDLSALHASIVKAFETGLIPLADGSLAPYLALEWLEGVSLAHEMKHRRGEGAPPMTLREVLRLLDAPARGLALAHERGIAHRDIKPGNLFFATRRTGAIVKVLDFGLAKILDDAVNTAAMMAETVGAVSSFTPMYAAPEQWLRRLGATGPWTDVHAWALVCLELLSGKPPFQGDESAQFMAACLDPALRPGPTALGVSVSPQVEAVFARALTIKPHDRFRSVGEFWSALCDKADGTSGHSDRLPPILSLAPTSVTDGSNEHRRSRTVDSLSIVHSTAPTASRLGRPSNAGKPRWRPLVLGVAISLASVIAVLARHSSRSLEAGPLLSGGHASAPEKTVTPLPPDESPRTIIAMTAADDDHRSGAVKEELQVQVGAASVASGDVKATPAASARRSSARASGATVEVSAVVDAGALPAASSAGPSRPPRSKVDLDHLIDNEELFHRR
ncbi:MAG TPA: serine/threonine-protein kinase [Polyangiaceae bacterium]|nr:serine/threonine-protein kinase [Polyangiaceae bacterium]